MIGIDTNILLRVFVRDEPESQSAAAIALVRAHAPDGVFVSLLVLAEFARVMTRKLKRTREETAHLLERIVEAPEFVVERSDLFVEALDLYRAAVLDLSDCLIVACARASGAMPLYTFDKSAARDIPGAVQLAF